MKAPHSNPVHNHRAFLVLTFFVLLVGLLLAPTEKIDLSVHGQIKQDTPKHSYASLDTEQIAALNTLYKELESGQPFSEEEKYILRRFAAGTQISELEGRIVSRYVPPRI